MGSPGASTRILTIPNALSGLRLASAPVFLWLWFEGSRNAAVVLYAVGAWTDFFDGVIARATNSVSELGKLLDPLADRVFIVVLAVALVVGGVLPLWLALVIVLRDLLILIAFPLLERKGMPRIEVNRVGKAATAALLLGLTLLALSETTLGGVEAAVVPGLVAVGLGAILYWAAAALYSREAVRRLRQLEQRGSA